MSENGRVCFPSLGQRAPEFYAETTMGKVNFPQDYAGRWVVLFSHPSDFTPVCTSEIATLASMQDEFEEINAALLGLSVDSTSSHLAWVKEIQDHIRFHDYTGQSVNFPIIADVKGVVAEKYGMIHDAISSDKTVRAVFVIDPEGKVRTILYYPLSTGRNFKEIKRIIEALQMTDASNLSTPADWQPGEEVLASAPENVNEMNLRADNSDHSLHCQDWFFCTRKYDA